MSPSPSLVVAQTHKLHPTTQAHTHTHTHTSCTPHHLTPAPHIGMLENLLNNHRRGPALGFRGG